jgi:hypothetical protein
MKYQNKAQFLARVQSGKIGGLVLWQGASLINGEPIVAVACRIAQASGNSKTGDMVQTFILPEPHDAGIEVNGSRPAKIMAWLKKTGARSICGECPHAWQWDESSGEYRKGACYVREYQSPAAVLAAVYRASYPIAGVDFPASWVSDCVAGLAVRLGSYGDPAAVPANIWARLILRAKSRTGYTHQWAGAFPAARANAYRARGYLMASCDSESDYSDAVDLGFRAFMVTPKGDATPRPGLMLCPASHEHEARTGKRTECAKCGACSGASGKGERMPSVFIPAHGATASRVKSCPAAASMVQAMGALS